MDFLPRASEKVRRHCAEMGACRRVGKCLVLLVALVFGSRGAGRLGATRRVGLRALRQRLLAGGLGLLLRGGVRLSALRLFRSADLLGALLGLCALLLGCLLARGLGLLALLLHLGATLLQRLSAFGLSLLPLLADRLLACRLRLLARNVALVFRLLTLRLRALAGHRALLLNRLLACRDGLLALRLGLLLRLLTLTDALARRVLLGKALLLGLLRGGVLPLLLNGDGLLLLGAPLLKLRVARGSGVALLVDAGLLAERGLLRIELRRRIAAALLLPAIEALRGLRALVAFGGEFRSAFGIVAVAIGAPLRVVLARAVPIGALAGDLRPAFGPLRSDHAAPLPVIGRRVQGERTRIVTRGIIRPPLRLIGRQRASVLIDRHHAPARIAVAVRGIAHEIRRIVARLVVIVSIAAVDRLGVGAVAAREFPTVRLDPAVIVERVIGWCVADHVADPVGTVDPRIGVRLGGRRICDPPRDRQRAGGGRGTHRRGGAADERLDLRQRRQRRVVADRDGGVAGRSLLVLGGLRPAGGERKRARGDQQSSRSKHLSCSIEGRNGLVTSHNASERDLASSFMPGLG